MLKTCLSFVKGKGHRAYFIKGRRRRAYFVKGVKGGNSFIL